ncbi:MAG: hypothetical protein HY332_00850 [Chloroflexi bacterium]|nr:hypothetical protein [Chloroflexota bacterium]
MPVIKVYVSELTPSLRARVPADLDGYPVRLEVSGEFQAFSGVVGNGRGR